MPYVFTAEQKQRFKEQGERQGAWIVDRPVGATLQVKNLHGLNVEVITATIEPAKVAAHKLSTLKDAIKILQDAGLMFAQADVKKFRALIYGEEFEQKPSRGVVYFDAVGDPKPCVLLELGSRLGKHVTKEPICPQIIDGITVAGGVRPRPPRVLADRIYDYYKPTATVSAKDKCALNQALHELGHIIHELTAPADYWLNADVAEAKIPGVAMRRSAELLAIKANGLKFVSQYSGADAKGLNEYVAEVFAGLLMGIPWSTIDTAGGVMRTYAALGGPVPPNMPASISRVDAFKTVSCACTANDHGEAFKYW